jgi:hypothetical protein
MQLQHIPPGVFCVATGFYDAKGFPPLFGRWRDAYTLRQFWGSVLVHYSAPYMLILAPPDEFGIS